jgi:hypothetical protein
VSSCRFPLCFASIIYEVGHSEKLNFREQDYRRMIISFVFNSAWPEYAS